MLRGHGRNGGGTIVLGSTGKPCQCFRIIFLVEHCGIRGSCQSSDKGVLRFRPFCGVFGLCFG